MLQRLQQMQARFIEAFNCSKAVQHTLTAHCWCCFNSKLPCRLCHVCKRDLYCAVPCSGADWGGSEQ